MEASKWCWRRLWMINSLYRKVNKHQAHPHQWCQSYLGLSFLYNNRTAKQRVAPIYKSFCLLLFLATDSFVNTQHALPQNITPFETPALPQPPFDQQSLTQGTKLFFCINSKYPPNRLVSHPLQQQLKTLFAAEMEFHHFIAIKL